MTTQLEISTVAAVKSIQTLRQQTAALTGVLKELGRTVSGLQAKLTGGAGVKRMGAQMKKTASDARLLSKEMLKQKNAAASAKQQFLGMTQRLKQVGAEAVRISNLRRSFVALEARLKSGKLTANQFSTAMRRFKASMGTAKREVTRLRTEDRKLAAAMRKAKSEARKLDSSMRRLGKATKETKKRTSNLAKTFQNLGSAAIFAVGPLSGIGARLVAFAAIATRTGVAIAALAAGFAALIVVVVKTVTAMVKTNLRLEKIRSRFMAVTGSVLLTNLAMKDALKTARKFGTDFEIAAEGLSQLQAAARGTILEGEGITKVFEGATAAISALRLGTAQASGVFRALEQIMTKGVVRAEELNQQLGDQLPGAAKIMASSLKVSTAQLIKMMAAGELLAEEVLPKFGKELLRLFSPQAEAGAESLQGALNKVGTELTILLDIMETRIGIVEFFAEELSDLAVALFNIGEMLRSTEGEIKRFFRALERDRPRFTLLGLSRQERNRIIGEIRELQAALLKEMEPLQLTISRTRGAVEGGILAQEFKFASRELAPLQAQFDKLARAVEEIKGFKLSDPIKKTGADFEKLTEAFEKLKASAIVARKEMSAVLSGDLLGAEFETSLGKAEKILVKFGEKVQKAFAESMGTTVDNLANQFARLIQNAKDFETLGKIFEDTRTPLEEYTAEMTKLETLLLRYPAHVEAIERAMKKLKEEFLKTDEFLVAISDGIKSFGSDLAGAIREGKNLVDVLINSFGNLLETLLEVAIQLLIIKPLLSAVGLPGGAASPTTLLGLPTNILGLPSKKGNVFSGSNVVPFRQGGVVNSPSTFGLGNGGIGSIAEDGPEGILPLKRTSSGKLGVEATGMGAPVVNFYLAPGMSVREFNDAQPQIAAMLSGTFAAAAASNG